MAFIKLKDGLCGVCDDGKLKPCIGKREDALCVTHWKSRHKRSAKGKKEDMIYADLKQKYIAEHPTCELMIEGICTHEAIDIHHTKGHGGHYLDPSTYKSACRPCHIYVGDHTQFAYDNGHSQKRLTIKE